MGISPTHPNLCIENRFLFPNIAFNYPIARVKECSEVN